MRLGHKHRSNRQGHVTRDGIAHQGATAFVGHVCPFHVGIFAHQGHGQVAQTAVANGAKAHVFLGLGGIQHVFEGFVFRVDVRGQHHGRCANQHQRCQVFLGVVRQVWVEGRVDAVRVKHHSKGVTIGCRLHHCRSANRARCATPVFHNHTLP